MSLTFLGISTALKMATCIFHALIACLVILIGILVFLFLIYKRIGMRSGKKSNENLD